MEVGRMTRRAREDIEFLFDDSIIAKPLAPSGIESTVLKNKNLYLKWINCSFQNGSMYDEAKAKGFVNAGPNDADVPGIPFKEGAFRYSEMILMKMDRNMALGAIKASTLRAMRQAGAPQETTTKRFLKDALSEVSGPQDLKKKIQVFTPTSKEAEALVGKGNEQTQNTVGG